MLQLPPQALITRESFGWVVGSLCATHRLAFDARLLDQEFPPPQSPQSLIKALGALSLKCGAISWAEALREQPPLPAIGFIKGPQVDGSQPPDLLPALILRIEHDRILYLLPDSPEPKIAPFSQATKLFVGDMVLAAPEVPQRGVEDGGNASVGAPRFGFRWFVPELLRHKGIWRDVLLASLAIQLVGLATPLFTQVVIDKVVVHHSRSTLITVVVAMALFVLFTAAMTWMRQYLVLHTGNRVDAVLGAKVFRHLLRLPIAFFENRPTGTLVARLQGIEDIRQFVAGAAVSLILDVPFLFVFVAVMFIYSVPLTLIALGLLTGLVILSAIVTPQFRARLNRQFLLGARNQAFVTEYVSGMATVKSLQLEPTLERRYGDFLASYLGTAFETRRLSNTYSVAASGLEQTMGLAILACGALLVMGNDGFTIGMLVAFQMFASRMSQPVMRLVGLWQEFQQANIAVKRLGDVLDMPTEPYSLQPQRSHAPTPARIDLHNLSFRYSERHPYLYKNVSLTLEAGKLTLILGPSGCGKSTLAKLLQAFYQPSDGVIRLDGADIRTFSANELRSMLGVVPQETTLFSGTVYENLQMAHPVATFEDIVQAAKLSGVHRTIEQLPQGYQTVLGEQGVGLSGGQRQRLAIARALLKKPRILIFDEATSGLDRENAQGFAQTVNELRDVVTIMFIAHVVPENLVVDRAYKLGADVRMMNKTQNAARAEQSQGVEDAKAKSGLRSVQ